jgi:signal transduction histidine kinase
MVRVTVADTGVGISPDEQAKIFDRFYQVSNKSGGAGLGLAICKQLIELQDGSISVESEPGLGSRFHFNLPNI